MKLTEYCDRPRTMADIEAAGYTRDQVYNAVKKGRLINQARRDAWGRIHRGPGLYIRPDAARIDEQGQYTATPPQYDAAPLVQAWGRTC